MMGATTVAETAYTFQEHPSSPPYFSEVRVAQVLVFCAMFCRSLFVFLSFIFWSLYYLSFELQLQITSFWYLQTFISKDT